MSVTVDANVLVYASDTADPAHATARSLMERVATGPEILYLFWPTLMSYLRIVTHPAILPRPLRPTDAMSNVAQLLALPHVRRLASSRGSGSSTERQPVTMLEATTCPISTWSR